MSLILLLLFYRDDTVDAWARSGEGGAAAQRAEALLQQMHELYQSGGHDSLRPTNVSICSCEINLEFGVLQSLISRLRH
jgi:hypothetical protein